MWWIVLSLRAKIMLPCFGPRLATRIHPETKPCVDYKRSHSQEGRQSLHEHGARLST